ncbi:TatD related DNase [compost metagenome]
MRFIDPTLYASRRGLPELELLAAAGAMAVVEPTTWQGIERRFAESHLDDFERLITGEARRAFTVRLGYAACLGVPPQEAEDEALARRVLERMPRFLGHERVAAIGEAGLSCGSAAEESIFRLQARLARHHGLPFVVRLPLYERSAIFARVVAILSEEGLAPGRVLVNGALEDVLPTLRAIGCWAGLAVGVNEGVSVEQAVQIVASRGPERLTLHSAAGRLGGDPLAVPRVARHLLGLGFAPEWVEQLLYHNPKAFFSLGRPLDIVEVGRTGVAPRPVEDDQLKAG